MWWNRYPEQRKIEGGSISIRMYVRYPPEMDGTGDTKALIPRDSLKGYTLKKLGKRRRKRLVLYVKHMDEEQKEYRYQIS